MHLRLRNLRYPVLPLLLLLGLAGILDGCGRPLIGPVQPLEDGLVTDASFEVTVLLGTRADPSTLEVRLNGQLLEMSGEAIRYAATVQPGPPLRDRNFLSVRVAGKNGAFLQKAGYFGYRPPKARAFRAEGADDCPSGPLAHCSPGDWVLANDVARFVVQDAPKRDMWSVGEFGGNLIDAERIVDGVPQGGDNFLEMQPTISVETVINATSVEIVNDGQDGTAAVVRSCGPDDLLDFVNPSTNIREALQGLGRPVPPELAAVDDADLDVEGCTEFTLEPGAASLRLVTTVMNYSPEDLGLFVGDWVNAAGEAAPWSVTAPSEVVSGGGIGEALTGSLEVFEYVGFGAAEGTNYAIVPIPFEGSTRPTDFLTASGVTLLLQNVSLFFTLLLNTPPSFVVPADGSKSYTRYFVVSDASRGGGVAEGLALRDLPSGTLQGCVSVGGESTPGARVALLQKNGDEIVDLVAHFVTDAEGCYGGPVPVGDFSVVGKPVGAPYEGGAATPLEHPVSIGDGTLVTQDIVLPQTGRLRVEVRDESGEPIPARVSVVGFDPSPAVTINSSGFQADQLGADTTGVFDEYGKSDLPFGLSRIAYAGADGRIDIAVEPGAYQIAVSRGFEYSVYQETVSIEPGPARELVARIARVVASDGFVSSDFHVHGLRSADSRVSNENRLLQFAGEGVDNVVMTDHNARTDLNPLIEELGLAPFLHATIGEEITTWDYGHFNGFPYEVDPSRPSGGSLDWGFRTPPGEGFPSLGNYILTPAELDAEGTTGPGTTPESVVQINHVGSTFGPLRIDTALVPPRSMLTPEEIASTRMDPTLDNLFHAFRAMEVVNGASQGSFDGAKNGSMGIWFNHLNQGLPMTGTGVSDTHNFEGLSAPGARTWTASPVDAPDQLDPQHVGASTRAGRASFGMGAFVTTRLVAEDDSGASASLAWGEETLLRSSAGVRLEIDVQSPVWAPYDRIEIYANADTFVTGTSGGVPVFYGATPERVLTAGVDFTVETRIVHPEVPGASRLETRHSVSFPELGEDTWFVVIVSGSDGVSRPMFPAAPKSLARGSNTDLDGLTDGNLGEGGTRAFGITNALYADVDGVPEFQPPWIPEP